jgi:hypothetical protein
MLTKEKTDIDGWIVELNFNEVKPDGWFPIYQEGCAIWATAELRRPTLLPLGWKQTALLRYPQFQLAAMFASASEGRDAAIAELTARIEAFRKE